MRINRWAETILAALMIGILAAVLVWGIGIAAQLPGRLTILSTLGTLQVMPVLMVTFALLSAGMVFAGLFTLFYFPLSLSFEFSKKHSIFGDDSPRVSVIVPAYNEGMVLRNCVRSIMGSDYGNFEVILVDDGSSDDTVSIMHEFIGDPRVKVIRQENRGKAAALNTGMQISQGEVVFFVDADGIFKPDTIRRMLAGFTSGKVGAVCGSDEPVNVDRLQTRLLSVQSHIGTGFVRRALARINCLPIVSGNIGAFRRKALADAMQQIEQDLKLFEMPEDLRPFREGFIGEDLELTWRVHAAGYRVNFAPDAMVLAEVPSTLHDLWKQRVRWARGFLQTAAIHKGLFFNLKHGPIGIYLPVNYFNMVVLPFLQLATLLCLVILVLAGYEPLALDLLGLVLWLGMGTVLFTSLWSICLDRAWRDLKYLYALPVWIPYTFMMNLVMLQAVLLELKGQRAAWNKVGRTGTVTRIIERNE